MNPIAHSLGDLPGVHFAPVPAPSKRPQEMSMAFTLPDLPYAENALEPAIDAQTMNIHHSKHHAAYVAKLNGALEGHADLAGMSIEDLCKGVADLPEAIRGAVRNNGGGHFNHSLFWQILAPPRRARSELSSRPRSTPPSARWTP